MPITFITQTKEEKNAIKKKYQEQRTRDIVGSIVDYSRANIDGVIQRTKSELIDHYSEMIMELFKE